MCARLCSGKGKVQKRRKVRTFIMAVRKESRRVGSFFFQVDQNVLGRSPGFCRGSGGMCPQENFGKIEPNPAILCILAVNTE